MPWQMPTLESLRATNRNNVQAKLRSAPLIPNSVARVMADSNAGLAYLTMLYIEWLALQLMPDTSETEWLDRHASIWLPNNGRKQATFSNGIVTCTGIQGIGVPAGTILQASKADGTILTFQTAYAINIGTGPTPVPVTALTPGTTGLQVNNTLSFQTGISGVTGSATITSFTEGIDQENDDQLRYRVLLRIHQPPMGGDAMDYVQWALQVPGVTRAWCSANELGIGTVTLRFMMDSVRADPNPMISGFPLQQDIVTMANYIDSKRPVSVKDRFIGPPVPYPINFTITGLNNENNLAEQEAIALGVADMLVQKGAPASTVNGIFIPPPPIYAAWVSDAILQASGVQYFTLLMNDQIMPYNGNLPVLGTIDYA